MQVSVVDEQRRRSKVVHDVSDSAGPNSSAPWLTPSATGRITWSWSWSSCFCQRHKCTMPVVVAVENHQQHQRNHLLIESRMSQRENSSVWWSHGSCCYYSTLSYRNAGTWYMKLDTRWLHRYTNLNSPFPTIAQCNGQCCECSPILTVSELTILWWEMLWIRLRRNRMTLIA